jgi:hypothetical protein
MPHATMEVKRSYQNNKKVFNTPSVKDMSPNDQIFSLKLEDDYRYFDKESGVPINL